MGRLGTLQRFKMPNIEKRVNDVAYRCFVCETEEYLPAFRGRIVDGHRFLLCVGCRMVVAKPVDPETTTDYAHYGDFLTDDGNVGRKMRVSSRSAASLLTKYRGKYQSLLDFGAGGGYFVRAAKDLGFRALGVEPSSALRDFAERRLDIQLCSRLEAVDERFDIITLFDVIEHIPDHEQRVLMSMLLSRLKPGGVLLGNTPNWRSANRLIRGEKDPAISPPSHVLYFTRKSLHLYLESLGLERVNLSTKGFRFFRSDKNRYSFLEQPAESFLIRWFVHNPLKLSLRVLSSIVSPLGLGYQIHFEYRAPFQ